MRFTTISNLVGHPEIARLFAAQDAIDIGGGAYKQPGRKFDPERLSGFEIEGQLDLYGLLDRHIGGFVALENAPGIGANEVRGDVGAAISSSARLLGRNTR